MLSARRPWLPSGRCGSASHTEIKFSNGCRIGVIGAGANTKLRHIPNLQASSIAIKLHIPQDERTPVTCHHLFHHWLQDIPGVHITTVCNRTLGSSRAAAAAFGIPGATSDWKEVINDPSIHAVVIGTWPNMHAMLTIAALEAGKHVLCEARMVGGRYRGMGRLMGEVGCKPASAWTLLLLPIPHGWRLRRP